MLKLMITRHRQAIWNQSWGNRTYNYFKYLRISDLSVYDLAVDLILAFWFALLWFKRHFSRVVRDYNTVPPMKWL